MQRPVALFSLALLAACNPTSKGGGTGGTSSSATSSDSTSGGIGGAGGSTNSSSSSATSGAGGSGGAGSSASSATSSGAGGAGGGSALHVAWTKIITTAPSYYTLDLKPSAISAKAPNRLFIGATLHGAYTFAGITLSGGTPHDASVVLALDGDGNEVDNLQFDSGGGAGYFPSYLKTDAATNLFVAGHGSGTQGYEYNKLQKYGASPWSTSLGPSSNFISSSAESLEIDAAGNPMAHMGVGMPGLNFGSGIQSGSLLLKEDGATGKYLWSKPAPEGHMFRDPNGDLLFFTVDPPTFTKLDTNGATLSTKSYVGALTYPGFATGKSGILMTALFQGTTDFGCGPLTSAGSGNDLLVVELDAAGKCLYSRRFGPIATMYGAGPLALTDAGEAVISGVNTSPFDFGGGPVPAGQFVLRLDPAGAFVSTWTMAMPASAAGDAAGAVYFASTHASFNVGTGPLLANDKGLAIAKVVP